MHVVVAHLFPALGVTHYFWTMDHPMWSITSCHVFRLYVSSCSTSLSGLDMAMETTESSTTINALLLSFPIPTHLLPLLQPARKHLYLSYAYVWRGTSCNAIKRPEYAFEEMIPTCSNIQKFHMRIPFSFFMYAFTQFLLSNMKALRIFQLCCNVKIGTISPSNHLNHFEHIEKKPIVEVSNNNELKLA